MKHEVAVENLGEGVEEAQFAAWLHSVGATVTEGEPLAEVMTDKVNIEIAAPVSGILAELRCAEDDTIKLGQTIAVIESAS
ncbi:biotin/lipoyl-containing protein [Nocardioides sp.]|uniref:biotin/lipoyl-containing protein n=1 Tax=Nocardioides sp. TaxID=35761 RepID=UPI003D12B13A